MSDTLEIDDDLVVDQNNDAIDKALEDLIKRFGSQYLESCSLGVYRVEYITASKEEITSSGVYYPYLLNVEYSIYYRVQRS